LVEEPGRERRGRGEEVLEWLARTPIRSSQQRVKEAGRKRRFEKPTCLASKT
jgi:hypothetical protein